MTLKELAEKHLTFCDHLMNVFRAPLVAEGGISTRPMVLDGSRMF